MGVPGACPSTPDTGPWLGAQQEGGGLSSGHLLWPQGSFYTRILEAQGG